MRQTFFVNGCFIWYTLRFPKMHETNQAPQIQEKIWGAWCDNTYYHTIVFFSLQFNFSELENKVVLIENTASLWGTTTRDFTQMNELCEKYGESLVILAFPTNQFGHQENSNGDEILNSLKYVRPGCEFEPKCILFEKVHTISIKVCPQDFYANSMYLFK